MCSGSIHLLGALSCFLRKELNFPLWALVSFISKKESNYLKAMRSHRDQIIHSYKALTGSPWDPVLLRTVVQTDLLKTTLLRLLGCVTLKELLGLSEMLLTSVTGSYHHLQWIVVRRLPPVISFCW